MRGILCAEGVCHAMLRALPAVHMRMLQYRGYKECAIQFVQWQLPLATYPARQLCYLLALCVV